MSLLAKTSRESFIYVVFQAAAMGLSLVSFPVLTRLFSLRDYGDMALVNSVLLVLVAVGKGGLTTSLIRFYPEYDSAEQRTMFCSTSFLGSFMISTLILLLFWSCLFLFRGSISSVLEKVLMIAGLMIVLKNLQYLYTSFERAEERVLFLNVVNLVFRAGPLALGLVFFLFMVKNLYGYFLGMVVFEGLFLVCLLYAVYKKNLLSARAISLPVFKKIFRYGFPLTFYEISALINDYSDRILIKYFLGSAQVGLYSAGYNLSFYIMQLISAPIWMTIFPIYTKLWKNEGKEATQKYLSSVLKYYFCLGVPIFFIVSALSREIILVLATSKFAESARIVPWVVGGAIVYGAVPIMNASFYLTKKTGKLAAYIAFCAALNFGLNLFVIPSLGIMGAAYTSAFSYVLLTVLLALSSRKTLKIAFPVKDVAFYSAFSISAVFLMSGIQFSERALNLFARLFLGFFVYAVCLLVYDAGLRKAVLDLYRKKGDLNVLLKKTEGAGD